MNKADQDKKPNESAQELTDQQLNGVSGGLTRRSTKEEPARCGLCGSTGACNCLDEFSIQR